MIWILILVFHSAQVGMMLIWVTEHSYQDSSLPWPCKANSEASMSWNFVHVVLLWQSLKMAILTFILNSLFSSVPTRWQTWEWVKYWFLYRWASEPRPSASIVSRFLVLWEKCSPMCSSLSLASFLIFAAANKLIWILLDTFGPQMSHWIERESFIWESDLKSSETIK